MQEGGEGGREVAREKERRAQQTAMHIYSVCITILLINNSKY
jgi:hypothetical protein